MTEKSKCLNEYIAINKQFQKSIRIDTDKNLSTSLDSYIGIRENINVIYRILLDISEGRNHVFTLTGPYGCGKSSLALVLSSFIDNLSLLNDKADAIVKNILEKENYDRINLLAGISNYRSINITAGSLGLRSSIISALGYEITEENQIRALEIIESEIQKENLFIIADEFGHFLERAFKENDILFFQNIAEKAARAEGKLVFIGVLHQSFESYVSKQSEGVKTEWNKIQGRYHNYNLFPNSINTLRLISESIEHKKEITDIDVNRMINASFVSKDAQASNSLQTLFTKLYPLHPLSGIILASFAKKPYGQNERSVFAFLSSTEEGSFYNFLETANYGDFYAPHNLFDFIKFNFEYQILSSTDSHAWTVVKQSLATLEQDHDILDINVFKCIICISIFAESYGITATQDVVCSCFDSNLKGAVTASLEKLIQSRTIIYRKFNHSYTLFDGSDFVLDKALKKELENVKIDYELLDEYIKSRVFYSAKEHYFKTGSLRWMELHIVDFDNLQTKLSDLSVNNECFGHFVIVISEYKQDAFKNFIDTYDIPDYLAVGYAKHSTELIEYLKQASALDTLKSSDSVEGDKIARREIQSHLDRVQEKISSILDGILYETDLYTSNGILKVINYNQACRYATEVADKIFKKYVCINNELINKNKLSANISSARRQLMYAMVNNTDQENLGFTKTPPSLCIYHTLLALKGIHSYSDKGYFFSKANSAMDTQIQFLYEHIKNNLIEAKDHCLTASNVYDLMSAAPLGIKNGPSPILLLAFILSYKNEVAVFDENYIITSYDASFVDAFLAYPEKIKIKWFKDVDFNESTLTNIKEALKSVGALRPLSQGHLAVAQDLVRFVLTQPHLTLATNRVSKDAISLKTCVKNAIDPIDLLFKQIPRIYNDIKETHATLASSLLEIKAYYPGVINQLASILFNSLDLDLDESGTLTQESMNSLLHRADIVKKNRASDKLVQFAVRLETIKNGVQAAIESIISLICEKTQKEWTDSSIYLVTQDIQQLSYDFRRSECFFALDEAKKNRRFFVSVIFSNPHSKELVSSFDVDQNKIDNSKQEIDKILEILKTKDKETTLAILSEIGIRLS